MADVQVAPAPYVAGRGFRCPFDEAFLVLAQDGLWSCASAPTHKWHRFGKGHENGPGAWKLMKTQDFRKKAGR